MNEAKYYQALRERQPDIYKWVMYMKAVFKEARPVKVEKNGQRNKNNS